MLLQKKEKGREKKIIIFFPFFLAVSCSLNELPVRSGRQAQGLVSAVGLARG